ncbi:neutrophil gelatinase-associated lipocalin [Brachionichthys hirsutus]|uniref:neutrophil gelatinase-associated lipocalin n=1 Tax=Brachionichthys hirsutus TaxID=412623 RepID=UPI003604EB2C
MGITVVAVVMVMCAMVVHADVKPQRDFDLQRFAGKWYRVGLAYDSPKFVPFRDKVKASMGFVTILPGGNVNLTMWDATPLGCQIKVYQYEKTNVAGQFTYYSTRHNMVKDITVVSTNYTDYALVLKHKVFNREYTQVALYGRSHSVRNNIIQRFRSFALSKGFSRDSILTPPPAENCPPSASGR